MRLKNKVAIITGASDGIGKQISLRLAKEGAKMALVARNKKNLQKVKQISLKLGAEKVEIYTCDITITKALEKTVKKIVSDFGEVNILINNAGIWQKLSPIEKIDERVVDSVIRVNLTALIHCTRLVLPYLKRQKEAAIINISSKSGVTGQEEQSVYAASKWGVRGFTEVLKTDLSGSSVRVAGVYQSGINTQMFKKAGENFNTKKFTNPADLADAVVYMLSRPKKIWLHEVRVEY
jgi:NADP-dependent 3-hydroxy acid dehydrogenase YdfG